jgi:hypothetical protein
VEWTRLLPGYVLADPDRHRLALVWTGALTAAVTLGRRGPPTARHLAIASAGFIAAAAAAAAVSHGTAQGRDAARLVGRAAVRMPGFRATPSAPARWGPEELRWGPTYEPHRHPDGAVVGERLRLPRGSYLLTIHAEGPPSATPPVLEVRPDPDPPAIPSAAPSRYPATRVSGGFAAVFDAGPREATWTLALREGGPFVLRAVSLEASTFPGATGLIR